MAMQRPHGVENIAPACLFWRFASLLPFLLNMSSASSQLFDEISGLGSTFIRALFPYSRRLKMKSETDICVPMSFPGGYVLGMFSALPKNAKIKTILFYLFKPLCTIATQQIPPKPRRCGLSPSTSRITGAPTPVMGVKVLGAMWASRLMRGKGGRDKKKTIPRASKPSCGYSYSFACKGMGVGDRRDG
jgi:hypothetical protein